MEGGSSPDNEVAVWCSYIYTLTDQFLSTSWLVMCKRFADTQLCTVLPAVLLVGVRGITPRLNPSIMLSTRAALWIYALDLQITGSWHYPCMTEVR